MSRVLVIDDDVDILKYCLAVLGPSGHEVLTVSDAQSALNLLQSHSVDLLIVDVMMPVATGFDLLQSVKRIKDFKAKILMLTARRKPSDVMKALELGATDYVCKPLDKDILVSKVQTILGKLPDTPKVKFAVGSAQSSADVRFATRVETLTEMGITIRTPSALGVNLRIKIETPIFNEMQIEPPLLRVASCVEVKVPESEIPYYEVFVSFIGLEESVMKKIRQWITQRSIALRKSA
jgi:CheY-like chemotaxis protein